MSGEKNQVLENMKTRRSIRKYKPDMVPKEIIEKIAEAGTYAATGMGKQSPIIIAVTNKELRDRLSKMNAQAGQGAETTGIPNSGRLSHFSRS